MPRLDFAGLAHVIARAALFVGGDTGPTHLADALGVPTIALFARSARRNVPERNRPYRGTGLQYDHGTDVEMVAASALEAVARGGRGAGERSGETGAVPAASPAE
jgi:hypothetical protein